MRTRLEFRQRISTDTRENQINSTIEEYLNQTLQEIQSPAWAFEQVSPMRGYAHKWSFNRKKYTLTTAEDSEFYQLPRNVDSIGLIRQTSTPAKIKFIPDNLFYNLIPNPTATGNPKWYRLWEEEGVLVRLSTDDTLEILSSSTEDTSQTVRISGIDSDGLPQTESISLNGTIVVEGCITWNTGDVLRISKSDDTTGIITVRETTADTVLVKLSPTERMARFKIISFYPIPSSELSLYIEYYTTIRRLEGDNDVPDIPEKWFWIIRLGTMAKVYQYQNKESLFNTTQSIYASAIRSMVKEDMGNTDYIPYLSSNIKGYNNGFIGLEDSYTISEV